MEIREQRYRKTAEDGIPEGKSESSGKRRRGTRGTLPGGVASLAIVLPFAGDYGWAVGAIADIIVFLPPMLIIVLLYRAAKKWLAVRRKKSSAYVKTFEVEISERESTLAAMSIAQEKGRTLSVEGGEEFEEMCVELAAENDLKLEDPRLQERVEEMKAFMPGMADKLQEKNK